MNPRRVFVMLAGYATVQVMGCALAAGISDGLTVPVKVGGEYEVIGELYVHEVVTDLNKRTVAFMVLVPLRLSGPEILSRRIVNPGSRIRIIAMRDRRWPAFLYPEQYVVEVDSIPSTVGVPVHLGLSRGNDDGYGSLNPEIYRPVK